VLLQRGRTAQLHKPTPCDIFLENNGPALSISLEEEKYLQHWRPWTEDGPLSTEMQQLLKPSGSGLLAEIP
jgi:hypothetical protein